MTNLAFASADTVGMTLYQLGDVLKSQEIHDIRFGPWQVPMSIDVVSDLTTPKEMTFWVTINKTLKLYLIVRDKESWLLVLDGNLSIPLTGTTLKARLDELEPRIREQFYWRDEVWAKEPFTSWWR